MQASKNKALRAFIFVFCLIALQFVSVKAYSQDAVSKALDLMNKNFILNNLPKAFSYGQFILNYYDGDEVPEETLDSVCEVVGAYTDELAEKEKWDEILELEDYFKKSPKRVQNAASKALKMANEAKNKKEEIKIEQVQQAQKNAEDEKFNKLFQQLQTNSKNQTDLEQQRQQQEIKYREDLAKIMLEMNESNSSTSKFNTFVFCFVILLFLGILTFVIYASIRQQRYNQEQMKSTLMTLQSMKNASRVEILPMNLGLENLMQQANGLPDNTQQRLISANSDDIEDAEIVVEDKETPEPILDNDEATLEEIKKVFVQCKQYGEQIDKVTGRKNATSKVAEIVFQISQRAGYSQNDSMLFYAVGMVYDIGFLNIDSTLFSADTLTEQQFETIKTHTVIGPNMMFFIDEKFRQIFKDAALMHHENIDGSGYPKGLKGDQIPFIARAIRVAESYVALVSSRNYKKITDSESALEELRSKSEYYDQKIVDILCEIE